MLGRTFRTGRRAFLLALGQRFVQRRLSLFERNAGAAAIDFLAGETLGGDFDVTGQQHHVGVGNRSRAQRIARADRALGFHLQVVAQTLRRLLQGFGSHERVSDASRAGGDRHQARGVFDDGSRFGGDVNLGLFSTAMQHRFDILQGLRRGAAEHALADKS